MPRFPRFPVRRPRPSAIFAAGAAVLILGTLGAVGASDATPDVFRPQTDPTTATVTGYNDGFIDGRADAIGDDNRDGHVDEDESGWDCHTMGNRVCGADVPPECEDAGEAVQLCVTVASRPAYGWTNPNGSRVDNPDGHAQVRDLEEKPGTPDFTAALRALDAEYREHAPRA
ncbi:hypothetical protein [Streptomyces sp. NBC_00268]|uniref:hypothetical protein n=1 Tax=Streptomyces sp. NBC_00268 TaxID=2975695 RepID=UPI00224D68F2|nr:hypothetical protein [Streptomyces sp. NBC_00268]MCX5182585.1 hypothetical protein [Streptomyces sp. NBC_00268]